MASKSLVARGQDWGARRKLWSSSLNHRAEVRQSQLPRGTVLTVHL